MTLFVGVACVAHSQSRVILYSFASISSTFVSYTFVWHVPYYVCMPPRGVHFFNRISRILCSSAVACCGLRFAPAGLTSIYWWHLRQIVYKSADEFPTKVL